MNILISCMGYDGGKSGISTYMRSVVEQLYKLPHKLTLVVETGSENDFPTCKKIIVSRLFSKSLMGMLWHFFILPLFTIHKRKYDAIIVLAASRRYLLFSRVPSIGVVHDLSQCRIKGKYDFLRMFYLCKIQPLIGPRYDHIVAISQSTKDDIIQFWKVSSDKITVNYNGLTPLPDADENVLERLHLKEYILYVSRLEHPGKNHCALLRAMELLPENVRQRFQLVFVGSDWNGADAIHKLAKNLAISKQVVFAGYVTNAELAALYNRASAFVFPSLSEGFGLPLIEAMSRGIPCTCSSTTALGEIGRGAAILFDPTNVNDIAASLQKVLVDENVRKDCIASGLQKSTLFSWSTHAKTLEQICKKFYDRYIIQEIFDIRFYNGRMHELLAMTEDIILRNSRKKIAFINAHYLNTAYDDPEQLACLNRFDYVFPDGSGVHIACKMFGIPYRDNLNGTDLLPLWCELFERKGWTMYFFASAENVANRAAVNLIKKYPKLKIVGCHSGFFTKEEEPRIIAEINRLNPDLLVVGFGVKLQERWVENNFEKLNCRIVAAMGGIMDVYSGDAPRGHPILHKLGLEWVRRLRNEPRRLAGRYLIGNPLFLWRILMSRFRKK